jgi:hypothetical protein
MRMMLRAVMDTEKGNEAIRNGSLGKIIEGVVEQIQPRPPTLRARTASVHVSWCLT